MVCTLCAILIHIITFSAMTLTLRYMKTLDIKQVSAIDHQSFDPPWPTDSYNFEINQSTVSHMVVLEDCAITPSYDQPPKSTGLWQQFTRWWQSEPENSSSTIVGYGGLWKIADEAHISTIATHPDYRGRNYGQILLAGMYGKAINLAAEYIVLEVRVSNDVAQHLYRKYRFTEFDIKKNYYRSNNEDAYDMRVTFDDDVMSNYDNLYSALQNKQSFVDEYTAMPHPRRD